jgi:hypothetical protein
VKLPRRARLLILTLGLLVDIALLVHHHDRFWWPPDDGVYAHVASRLAHGQVLDRDIEENHPGYIHWVHAAAFRLFGEDFVSLRYPLVAAASLQAALAIALLASSGLIEALLAGLAAVALGVVQFLNPQPHWYCALVAMGLVALLTWVPREARWRLPALGFLLAVALLLRQLTGFFLGIGVLLVLLSEPGEATTGAQKLGGRAVLATTAAGLLVYQAVTTDLLGLLLFGAWPVLLIGSVGGAVTTSNRQLLRGAGGLALGAVAGALPVLAYHLAHGSLRWWVRDAVVRASSVTALPYLHESRYWHFLAGGLRGLGRVDDGRLFVNGLYWCLLLLLPAAAGLATLLHFRARHRLTPLGAIAVSYGLVALFNQIAIYLYYIAALSLAALLLLTSKQRPAWRAAAAATAAFVLTVALVFHAAEPLSRGARGMLEGTHVALVPSGLSRCALAIDPTDRAVYRAVLERIAARTGANEPIFVFPNHAELYFLSGRTNPVRFYSTALGMQRPDELAAVLTQLAAIRPGLVIHAPRDPNTTALSNELMRQLGARYRLFETVGPFDLYEPTAAR